VGAVFAFGFDIHLPLAAESIEIIDEKTAHEGLDRAIGVAQIDALLQNLIPI
jgi:hypothetical protein